MLAALPALIATVDDEQLFRALPASVLFSSSLCAGIGYQRLMTRRMPSSLSCLFHPPHHTAQQRSTLRSLSPPLQSPPSSSHSLSSSFLLPHSSPSSRLVVRHLPCYLSLVLLLLLTLTRPALSQTTLYATWTTVPSSPPPGRCLSSLVGDSALAKMLLVGGRDSNGAMSDVWVGSIDSSQNIAWQQQQYSNTTAQPGARFGHTSYLDNNGAVLLYGGVDEDGHYLDDIWSFSTSTAAWSAVRVPSFNRQPTTASPDLQTVQPSARAFTHWRPFTLTYGVLRGLQGGLETPNLLAYLNNTSTASDSSTFDTLFLFGGRSSPGDIYSTEWSNQPASPTNITDASSFNEDFGDLWLYVYGADTWIRIGNATCTADELICADYTTVANLSSLIPGLLVDLNSEASLPSRPAGLLNRTIALLNTTTWLNEVLYGVDQLLRSTPSLTEDDQNSCYSQCLEKEEMPSPTIYTPPTQCTSGGGTPLSGTGVTFCNVSTVGNVISQLRPNASEGSAMATHNLSNGTYSWTYVWQFGGFGCASGGVDIFSVSNWSDDCFIQALSVLNPMTLVWYTFQPPEQVNSQYVTWPSARAYAAMAIDQTNSLLWLYGGAAVSGGSWTYYDDMYAFDITARAWVTVQITSIAPAPGIGANLVWLAPSVNNTSSGLYLYGGCSNAGYSNQLLLLQTSSTVAAYNWQAVGTALSTAVAGVETSFLLIARSILPNGSFTNQTLSYAVGLASFFSITISATDSSGNTFVEADNVIPTEIDNGVYAVNYTVDYGATLSIAIYFLSNDLYTPIPNSPFSLNLLTNAYSPSDTVVVSSNYSTVEKGTQTFIVVQLRDQYNNDLTSSPGTPPPAFTMWYYSGAVTDSTAAPHCIASHSEPLDGGGSYDSNNQNNNTNSTTPGSSVQIYQLDTIANDNRDGTFALTYIVPPVDAYYLFILVNCIEITDSPVAVSALNPLVLPVGLQAAFLALALVVGSVVFGLMVVLVVYRNNRVVRAGSTFFLVLICIGVLLCIASVPIYAYPSSTNCRLFPFLLTTGYIIALSALCSKSYRVLLIFTKHKHDSVFFALSDTAMVVPVVILLVGETIINIVWLVGSPLDYLEYADSSSSVLTYHACGGQHVTAFVSASVAYNGLVALWGVWLALQIRHVPEAFGESKLMGAALYNLALVMAITIPLTWTASNTQSSHEDLIIPGAAVLWCSFVTIGLVVAPKLYYIVYPPPQHYFDGYSTGNNATTKGTRAEKRGSNHADKERSDELDRPADGNNGTSPANTTINGNTWSPANNIKLPSSSASVKDDGGRLSSYPQSSKRMSHSPGLAAVSLQSLDTSPLQLSPAMSSVAMERQITSGSTASMHQVQIDIQSPALSSPNGAIRLMSHEQQHIGLATAVEMAESDGEGKRLARAESASQNSFSPPSVARRSAQPSSQHNSHTDAARRGYTASPAMQYSQSSVSSPYVTSTPAYFSNSLPSPMRTSLSVDDLGYPPVRPAYKLPPGPQLAVSFSHTGSPVHTSGSRVAGGGVRAPSAHRVSISSQQSSQLTPVAGEPRDVE